MLFSGVPVLADGGGAIGGVSVDKASPQAGDGIVVQVAIAPSDVVWTAGSYQAKVELRTSEGSVIAESAPVAGDAQVAAGQIASLFVPLTVPQNAGGPLVLRVIVSHGGAVVGDDVQTAIVVGAIAATTGTPTATGQPAGALTGNLNTNTNFAAQQTQSAAFAFNEKYLGDRSFTSTFGLSTVPGQSRPILGFQTQQSLTQVGTFTIGYDPLILNGATGSGLSYRRQITLGSALQIAYLSGALCARRGRQPHERQRIADLRDGRERRHVRGKYRNGRGEHKRSDDRRHRSPGPEPRTTRDDHDPLCADAAG